MKKRHLLSLALLCCATALWADPVGLEKARSLAQEFLVEGTTPKLVKTAKRAKPLRTISQDCSPYYIFSRGEGKGYVIVSGDDCLPNILGVTDSGDFDENNMAPQLAEWLDTYRQAIEYAQAHNAPARTQHKAPSSWTSIVPLIQDHWGQYSPYNNLCPYLTGTTNRAVTGCVATSGSEAVYYYHKDNPDTLMAATPTYADDDAPVTVSLPRGTPVKWDLMQLSYSSNITYPVEMTNAVATLLYAVGTATHLNYGSSTSGYIADLVDTYYDYFNLSSTSLYQSSIAQDTWEEMIYNDLKKGHPIVYTGVTTDGKSGHAFILDGYSNSRYHFNFGWNGQSDGYYTLDIKTGVNGFCTWQGMTYQIRPRKPKVTGTLTKPISSYLRVTGQVTAHIENKGTLPYSGFYLLASTTKSVPALTSAYDKDLITEIPVDGSADLTFNFKPTVDKDYTLFLTDGVRTILDSVTIKIKDSTPDLHMLGVKVNAAPESETVNGKNYQAVYNSKSNVTITVENRSDNYYEGVMRLNIKANEDANDSAFTFSATKTQNVVFAPHETKEVVYTTNTLDVAKYYMAQIQNVVSSVSYKSYFTMEGDSIVYFRSRGNQLVCDTCIEGNCTVTGKWNSDVFAAIVAAYPQATSFDLTAVAGVDQLPQAVNPNCLFYVADNATATGNNIIKGGVCQSLVLAKGYDFAPKSDFTAVEATYNPGTPCNVWETLYLPFSCTVPDGCVAKRLTEATSAKLTFEQVNELKAGTPYFYLCSAERHHALTASNALVTLKGENSGSTCFMGTYSAIVVPDSIMQLTKGTTQYFENNGDSVITAFNGFMAVEGAHRIRPNNLTSDPKYQLLGAEISTSYGLYDSNEQYATDENKDLFMAAIYAAEDSLEAQSLTSTVKVANLTKTLQEAETAFMAGLIGTADHPIEYTDRLTNPSFELKSTNGWRVINGLSAGAKPISSFSYYGVGTDGAYLFYTNGKSSNGDEAILQQTVTGLPAGTYVVKALVGGDENTSATLFANEQSTLVSAHKFGKFYFNEGEAMVYLPQDSALTVGVKSPLLFKADNFRLYYLGTENLIPTDVKSVTIGESLPGNSLQVIGGKGKVILNTKLASTVAVYLPDGRLVRTVKVVAGSNSIEGLKKGIYIIEHHKVLVK